MVAMTSPLHRAVERPFCVCQLLHFANCSQTQHRPRTWVHLRKANETIGPMGANDPQIHPSLEAREPHLIHECLGDPAHHRKRQLDRCTHFRTTTQQRPHWLQWDASNSPPKLPFPFDYYHDQLIHPSLVRPHSPSQTVSGSNLPFCHNTLCGPTDRPTDGLTDRQMVQANVP